MRQAYAVGSRRDKQHDVTVQQCRMHAMCKQATIWGFLSRNGDQQKGVASGPLVNRLVAGRSFGPSIDLCLHCKFAAFWQSLHLTSITTND